MGELYAFYHCANGSKFMSASGLKREWVQREGDEKEEQTNEHKKKS